MNSDDSGKLVSKADSVNLSEIQIEGIFCVTYNILLMEDDFFGSHGTLNFWAFAGILLVFGSFHSEFTVLRDGLVDLFKIKLKFSYEGSFQIPGDVCLWNSCELKILKDKREI